MAGASPFTVMTNFLSLNSANSVKHLGKTPMVALKSRGEEPGHMQV